MTIAFSIDFPRIVAVELAGSAKKPRLKRVVVGDLPEPRNEDGTPVVDKQGFLNTAVGEFLKTHKLTSGKQYLLVGPDAVRYRDLRLAFSDHRRIEKILPFQVEGLIPNIPIEDLSLGFIVLEEFGDKEGQTAGEGCKVLVHAADRAYIMPRLIALEEGGASIAAVDDHLDGTLNLGRLHPQLAASQPPTLWLDFAGSTAMVCLMDGKRVRSARVFFSPYLAGAEAAAERAKQEAREAQVAAEARAREFQEEQGTATDSVTLPKTESVNIGSEQVADRIKHMSRDDMLKFLQRVAIEARRTILMAGGNYEPARLVVSGLGDSGTQIVELLANELQMTESHAIDLMDSVNPPHKDGKPSVDVPDIGELTYLTGVALKGFGLDEDKIDFRYGTLAPGTLFDYAKTPLAFTATLSLLFAGILYLISYSHSTQFEAQIVDLRDAPNGPKYYFEAAFEKVDKTKPVSKEVEKERTYVAIEDDPGQEIRNAHKKLKDHQKRLLGETSDNYARPQPADQILLKVLETFQNGKPSYDFAMVSFRIQNNLVTIEFFCSVTETAAERKLLGVGDLTESERMFRAFRELATANTQWFDTAPDAYSGDVTAKAQAGPENRVVDVAKVTIRLKKVEPPKKPAATPAKKTS